MAFWNMRKKKETKTDRNDQFFTYADYSSKEWKEFIGFHAKENAKKRLFIYVTKPWSNRHIFDFLPLQHRSSLVTRHHSHIVFTISIHVFGINGVFVSRGGMSHKNIPFLVDHIVKKLSYWPKNPKDCPTFRNIFAGHSHGPLSSN